MPITAKHLQHWQVGLLLSTQFQPSKLGYFNPNNVKTVIS